MTKQISAGRKKTQRRIEHTPSGARGAMSKPLRMMHYVHSQREETPVSRCGAVCDAKLIQCLALERLVMRQENATGRQWLFYGFFLLTRPRACKHRGGPLIAMRGSLRASRLMHYCQPSRVRQSEALLERNKKKCGGEAGSLQLVFQLLATLPSNHALHGRQVLAEWLRGTCNAEINPLFVFFRVCVGTAEQKNLCWPPSWKVAAGSGKRPCHHMSPPRKPSWLSVCHTALFCSHLVS